MRGRTPADSALTFEGVSKDYRQGVGYHALRDDLTRLLSLGRAGAPDAPKVKALEDVNLEVKTGQATAIIGRNGAGKSTALKIASRVTYPTEGRVTVRGRVGALIEIGTGLHPELSGRENILLYGQILGLSAADVRRRFDDIVEFAGIQAAIDDPVKYYSSGMELRLGFAIAAHLEPDILIVDEAISVGDPGFQYKCVERMSSLVREGRTLLLVSHNMMAVEALCRRAILLEDGRITLDGDARDVVAAYLGRIQHQLLQDAHGHPITGTGIEILGVRVLDADGGDISVIRPGDPLRVRVDYHAARRIGTPLFSIGIGDPVAGVLTVASMLVDGNHPASLEGPGWVECTFASPPLKPRTYDIYGEVREGFGRLVEWQRWARFRIDDPELAHPGLNGVSRSLLTAPVAVPYVWRFPNGHAQAANGCSREEPERLTG